MILYGNPAKPGLYITINKFSNGFNRPHYHPSDRFSYVLQGTWWVGTGAKFDPNNTVADAARHGRDPYRKAASTSMARRKATRSC